jgi:hypothetical protein
MSAALEEVNLTRQENIFAGLSPIRSLPANSLNCSFWS